MTKDEIIYVDHVQLHVRGWTRGLVKRFLKAPDNWATVNHWANFKGKALYCVERVMLTESRLDFMAAYDASIKRRKLSSEFLAEVVAERIRGNDQYKAWLKALTPEQVQTMIVVQEFAAVLEEGRARGYRTPHK